MNLDIYTPSIFSYTGQLCINTLKGEKIIKKKENVKQEDINMKKSIINELLKDKYVEIHVTTEEFFELLNELIQITIKEHKDKFKILLNTNNIINFSMVIFDLSSYKMYQLKCAENVDNLKNLFSKITIEKLENVDRIILIANFDEDDYNDNHNVIFIEYIFVDKIIEGYLYIVEELFYNHTEYLHAFIPDNVSYDIFEHLCLLRKVLGLFVHTITFHILCLCNYFDQSEEKEEGGV